MDTLIQSLQQYFPKHRFDIGNLSVINEGRFANAIVYRYRDAVFDLVIKDFSSRHWLIKHSVGRIFINQEFKAISALKHIDGVAEQCYRLSASTIAYSYVEGQTLKSLSESGEQLPPRFFYQLEQRISAMHRAGRVHLDLRNMGNILVDMRGEPVIIDFQSSIRWHSLPRWLARFMRGADITGTYKAWQRFGGTPLPRFRRGFYENYNRVRKIWIFRGYPLHRLQIRVQALFANLLSLDIVKNILEKFW